ncbi:hypothetical protein C7Y66_13445 [Chroococcidiopsis sp. CCALA 051]|uniref:NINE protein n=1 Tax=Chroococcidiopsis sp. CCALA 051 TaxID=869949 RepID=UPI000D0C97AA|nr:NINE protein [Chroococcidiopsis sp. CCALA 051]PSM48628.1 hypothetical protein C7Y66_13445 [Chroococcidiopsis sp. CCALA 051]
MRETGVAYIFWCACLLGVCGVQRFYCGKYVSGIIYLFTVGLLGIGQLVDLALIPGMVEEKNLKYKLLHGSPNANMTNNQSVVINLGEQVASFMSSAQATTNQKSDIQIILQLAKDNGGSVSTADCVLATGKPVIEVKKTLTSMCTDGLLEVYNRPDTGAIVYRII